MNDRKEWHEWDHELESPSSSTTSAAGDILDPKLSPRSGLLRETWEILKILIISVVIVLPIRYFVVQPFIVRGASMEPTFEDRQYLIIDEISYYFRKPHRGEVVIFRYPRDPSQFFIKRIIGLPGERVEIQGGRVMIFNALHPEGALMEEMYLSPPNRPTHPHLSISLDADEYFVLGDNRDSSSDSRVWGPLPDKLIIGRVVFRVLPLNQFGVVEP